MARTSNVLFASMLSPLAGTLVLLGCYFLVYPRIRSLPPVAEADAAALGLRSPTN